MATRRSKRRRRLGLYWVETDDHRRDWFVVAASEHEGASYFEQAEGYEIGDAVATPVARVPPGVAAEPGWPSEEVLKACGAALVRADTPRVVEVAGRRLHEGAGAARTGAGGAARLVASAPAKKVHRSGPILPGEPRPLRRRRLQRRRRRKRGATAPARG